MTDSLKKYLDKINIKYSNIQLEKLASYCLELIEWNKKFNLVKISSIEDLIVNHIIDSLLGLNFISNLNCKNFCDVGSGAGLPGIVLAIFLENSKWTLIERSKKRASFLRYITLLLKINDRVSILEDDILNVKNKFECLTFRAFRQFEDFIFPILKITEQGGVICAYKSTDSKIETEIKNCLLKNQYKIEKLENPFLKNQRHLLIVEN